MTLQLEIINPLTFPGWDELLLSHPESNFFHSTMWAGVLCDTFAYEPLYFTGIDNNKLSVLIPVMEINSPLTGRRGVSLPFTDICEPIIGDPARFNDAMANVLDYGEKSRWKSFVLNGGTRFLQEKTPSHNYYTHVLDLTRDEEQIFAGFQGSTKRNVKKAIREGVQIEISESSESINEFYRLYGITRRRHGTAIEPLAFFENVYRNVISKGNGNVVLASHGKKYIGTAVFFHFGKFVFYQFGASDLTYQHLRPNNLIMWEAIKWYRQKGFELFSFGTTEFDNTGLRQFKSGMATTEETLGYYVYNFEKHDFIFHRSLHSPKKRNILRMAPITFLKLLGAIFYRHTNSYYYLNTRNNKS